MEFLGLPILHFTKQKEWFGWLEKNYGQPEGVWLKFAKKASGEVSISYEEAREGALMYGWIDGQSRRLDEKFQLIRFTQRRARSTWSKINCGIVEQLIADGKIKPSGLAQVEAAKKDGRWDAAYDGQGNITVPADFQQALNKNPKAQAFFDTLNKTNRFSYLWRVQTAAKPEVRAARIAKLIAMLNEAKKFH